MNAPTLRRSVPDPSPSASSCGKRVGITTLGCKVNTFESQLIAQKLADLDWVVVDAREAADLYIINTCTVTQEADRQARQAVRRAIRRNPEARIVVTGCYAQMSAQGCADIPGVDLVVGNGRKLDIGALLPQAKQPSASPRIVVGSLDEHVGLPDRLLTGYEEQTRAFVQIQQGCNQGCTFCIIHRARGPSRSLPPTMVKQQVRHLAASGYKEVVICGVDVGSYGRDLDPYAVLGYGLADLLKELCCIDGDFRIRLSSIDPAHIDRGFIEVLQQPGLCPHLHLSLQSGNSLILKRMKRRYSAEQAYAAVMELRQKIPSLVLSADVMVGFPTETEAQFEDTLHMIEQLEIAYPHVFPYSARPGTPAAKIPKDRQVPTAERKSRARKLRQMGAQVRAELLHSRIGSRARVLIEGGVCPLPGFQKGRAPDYLEVWAPVGEDQVGEWADVVYESVRGDALIAGLAAGR